MPTSACCQLAFMLHGPAHCLLLLLLLPPLLGQK
jgi:hypothetical protein